MQFFLGDANIKSQPFRTKYNTFNTKRHKNTAKWRRICIL